MSDPTQPADPKVRLAQLKAELAAVAAKRAERDALNAVTAELAAAERALADEKAITQAECEHGAVGEMLSVIRTPTHGVIIVKRPSPLVFRRFRDQSTHNSEELGKLIRPSLVYPSLTQLELIFDEQPALETVVADQVCILAGMGRAQLGGK
jgi:hypothetical protein